MSERGPVVVVVTFGPSRSRRLSAALARARRAGVVVHELSPGRFRATFTLGSDARDHGRAWALVSEVGSLGATEIDVDGSPESARDVADMAECARRWLRARGGCRQVFWQGEPFPRCHVCPLYDPDRLDIRPEPRAEPRIEIPDHLPEGWGE